MTEPAERIARYERLRKRTTPVADGGEGMTQEQAGAAEGLTRARVSRILQAGPPRSLLGGRPATNPERARRRVSDRIRYFEHKRANLDPVLDREAIAGIDAEIASLRSEEAQID